MAVPDGEQFKFLDETHIKPSFLEVFEFESPDQYIKTETNEFSAVCPFSGLPDIANVIIEYYPLGKKCVELKALNITSLALELWGFIKKPQQNVFIQI